MILKKYKNRVFVKKLDIIRIDQCTTNDEIIIKMNDNILNKILLDKKKGLKTLNERVEEW